MSSSLFHNPDKMELTVKLNAIAAQEGNDGEEYDLMVEAADRISELQAKLDAVEAYARNLPDRYGHPKDKSIVTEIADELEAKLDAVEQQDSEYTRTLEVAVTAASLLPEKWRSEYADWQNGCADELEAALAGTNAK